MTSYRELVLTFLLLFTLSGISAQVNILRSEVEEYGQARIKITLANPDDIKTLSENVSVSSLTDNTAEVVISPLTLGWFISRDYKYVILERPDSKSIITAKDVSEAMEWDVYPSFTQYDSIMRGFARSYPSLCVLDTIGTSIYGKLILVVKISDNAVQDENEPEVFYTSTMHGDETAGFVLMLRLADYLLSNYDTDNRIKNIVDNLEIWINPLSNPDGTYRSGDIIINPVRSNANGYDLNRNFPDPGVSNVVRQKETLDMMKFMQEHHFVLSANFHSGAEVVNYPWDRWSRLHADDTWFYSISRKYADTVHICAPATYLNDHQNGVTNGYDWYSIRGGRQDYVTYDLRGREVTIELVNSYVTPVDQLDPLWQYNRCSLLGYIENAMYGIHGTVTDAYSGEPLRVKIYINGHDTDSSHVYSETSTGFFVRLIAPGTWDLSFTAPGYYDIEMNDIEVADGEKKELFIEMVPFVSPLDTIATPSLIIYPVPSNDYVKVILPQRHHGNINIRMFNMQGIMMKEYDEDASSGYPVNIEIAELPPGIYILKITNTDTDFSDISRLIVTGR